MSELYPVFTSAGLAAIEAAHAQGLSVKISHLALGDGAYDVRDVNGVALASARARVALDNERVRVALSAGGALGHNQVLVEAIVAGGAPEFWIKEIGFVAEDGTLLCIWSSATSNLGYRGTADWVFRYVLAWTDLPADAITVVYDGDAAYTALSIDHERLEAKVRHTVAAGALVWADGDDTQLTAAIDARIASLAANTYDTPFNAGWGSDMNGEDLVVQSFAPVLLCRDITILGEVSWAGVAPVGADIVFDIEKNGASIYTTKPKVVAGTNVGVAGVLDATKVDCSADDRLIFGITQVGVAAKGQKLLVTLKAKVR